MNDRSSIVLNSIVFLGLCAAVVWISAPSISNYFNQDDKIIAIANVFNMKAIRSSNHETKFDSAEAGIGKQIIYNYKLVNYKASQIDPYVLKIGTRPDLLKDVKYKNEYEELRKLNADMVFVYRTNDDIEVARIEITPLDYNS